MADKKYYTHDEAKAYLLQQVQSAHGDRAALILALAFVIEDPAELKQVIEAMNAA